MGMCLDGVGKVSVEVRRESFIVHHENEDGPHPEYWMTDLDDLIAALTEAREYLSRRGELHAER